jgi:hypothetical protein
MKLSVAAKVAASIFEHGAMTVGMVSGAATPIVAPVIAMPPRHDSDEAKSAALNSLPCQEFAFCWALPPSTAVYTASSFVAIEP